MVTRTPRPDLHNRVNGVQSVGPRQGSVFHQQVKLAKIVSVNQLVPHRPRSAVVHQRA